LRSPANDFFPPVKENIGRGTGIGTLIPICPHSISFSNLCAADPDFVKIAHPFPQGLLFVKSIAY
jgi:hypothetical protein